MARRRMVSLDILDCDTFTNCSLTARYLYIELTARADDHGFCAGVHRTIKMIGCTHEDLKELINSGLIIAFDTGVYLITDWLVANRIQPTRLQPTIYEKEAAYIRIVGKRYEIASETNRDFESLLSRSSCGGNADYEAWESYNNRE